MDGAPTVCAPGFEVFDAFGPTLHAPPAWFDSGSGLNERVRRVQGAVEPTLWGRRCKRRQRWHMQEAKGGVEAGLWGVVQPCVQPVQRGGASALRAAPG